MLIEAFEDQMQMKLRKSQREKLNLIEVNFIMMGYELEYSSGVIYFSIDDEIQFYVYYSDFSTSWVITNISNINQKRYTTYNLEELLDKLTKNFIKDEEKYDVSKTI